MDDQERLQYNERRNKWQRDFYKQKMVRRKDYFDGISNAYFPVFLLVYFF